jgi:hypothetical protein
MNFEQLLTTPPALHGPEGAETNGWRLDDAGLRFLDSHVKEGMRTIETGAGVSTIAIPVSCPTAASSVEYAGIVRGRECRCTR